MTSKDQTKPRPNAPEPFVTGRPGASALFIAFLLAAAALFSGLNNGDGTAITTGETEFFLLVIGFITVGPLIVTRSLRIALTRNGWIGVSLLIAFILWSGLSVLWSADDGKTWDSLNLNLGYLLMLTVAVALATSHPRGAGWIRSGMLGVATIVAGYGFATKAIPGVDIKGVVNFDHGPGLGIGTPVGSPQILGAICVLALPLAFLSMTGSGKLARPFGLFASVLLTTSAGLTCSRGVVIGIIAMLFVTAIVGKTWRYIWPFFIAVVLATPSLVYAFHEDRIWQQTTPLGKREDAGLILLAIFLGSVVFGIIVQFLIRQKKSHGTNQRFRHLSPVRGLAAIALLAFAVGATAATFSDKGFEGSLRSGWTMFTNQAPPIGQPKRLTSVKNGDRYELWQEATGMLSDRVVGGWGSGSFAVAHTPYASKQTTTMAGSETGLLTIAAETGLVGFLLWFGSFAALFLAAIKHAREEQNKQRDQDSAIRLATLTILTGFLIFETTISCWTTPAVMLPVFAIIGVSIHKPVFHRDPRSTRAFIDSRLAWSIVALIALSSLVVSSGAPYLAAQETHHALKVARKQGASEQDFADAATAAATAARLNPLSVEPLLTAATIAQQRNRLLDSRDYLLAATRKQPRNAVIWTRLAELALQLADFKGAQAAAQRAARYTPSSLQTQNLLSRAQQALFAPSSSPTAIGTPLSLAPNPAEQNPATLSPTGQPNTISPNGIPQTQQPTP